MNNSGFSHTSFSHKQAGLTLVELLVSMTISVLILVSVVQIYLTSAKTVRSFDGNSRIQENARYAFYRVELDLGNVGNMGCFSTPALTDPANRIFSVLADTSDKYNYATFMGGEEAAALGVGGNTSTDTAVLRFASTGQRYPVLNIDKSNYKLTLDSAVVDLIEEGQVVVIGDCSQSTVFSVSSVDIGNDKIGYAVGADEDGDPLNAYPNDPEPYLQAEYVAASDANTLAEGIARANIYVGGSAAIEYQVATSTAGAAAGGECGSTNPEYCALTRDGEEIVSGVEDLQWEYGWLDTTDSKLKFYDAKDIEDDAKTDEIWMRVDRVRITMTFNSINTANTTQGLSLLKRTYSQVFAIPNQLPQSI